MYASPALYRLLNAAALDADFRSLFLAAPIRAALLAEQDPQAAFGCPLPDPVLTLAPIRLEDGDWRFLRQMPPAASLAEVWRQLQQGLATAVSLDTNVATEAARVSEAPGVFDEGRGSTNTSLRETRLPNEFRGVRQRGRLGRALLAAS